MNIIDINFQINRYFRRISHDPLALCALQLHVLLKQCVLLDTHWVRYLNNASKKCKQWIYKTDVRRKNTVTTYSQWMDIVVRVTYLRYNCFRKYLNGLCIFPDKPTKSMRVVCVGDVNATNITRLFHQRDNWMIKKKLPLNNVTLQSDEQCT